MMSGAGRWSHQLNAVIIVLLLSYVKRSHSIIPLCRWENINIREQEEEKEEEEKKEEEEEEKVEENLLVCT